MAVRTDDHKQQPALGTSDQPTITDHRIHTEMATQNSDAMCVWRSAPPTPSSAPSLSKPFRFRDLPAEIRNCIYEEALTHNRIDRRTANTSLLRVCKQIYVEAKGIFDANSVFSIMMTPEESIDFDEGSHHNSHHNTTEDAQAESLLMIQGDLRLTRQHDVALDTFYDKFPQALQDAPGVHITIAGQPAGYACWTIWTLQCIIYGLVSSLQSASTSQTRKRNLQISVPDIQTDADKQTEVPLVGKMLVFPFAKLPACFQITCNIPGMRENFNKLREKAANDLAINTTVEYSRLRQDIDVLIACKHELPAGVPRRVFDRVKDHAELLQSSFDVDSQYWILMPTEMGLILSVRLVRHWLKFLEEVGDHEKWARVLESIGEIGKEDIMYEDEDLAFWFE